MTLSKTLITTLILLVAGVFISLGFLQVHIPRFIDSPSQSTQPPNPTIRSSSPAPAPTTTQKTFTSQKFGYELKYPNDWGFVNQGDDGFVDFGPGNPVPAGGKILLDMQCLYGTGTQIYGEQTTSTTQQVKFGNNQYTEKKIFVVNNSEKRLAFHNFTINLPSEYKDNQCNTASFIVREEFDQNVLKGILSTFKLIR